jgi:hypothetical protein
MPRTPQPLNIFRKDLMHLWPETLIVVALFVACAYASPSRWTGSQNEVAGLIPILAIFLKAFLMPVSWLVLVSRLIHDEPLVGDRQFWTSRPYHWASLLAAKVLYLLAFLYLPFLLMQVYLLKHAGLYPTTAIPELMHNLLLLTVLIVIPIAAISAVTSTFVKTLLSFIGAIVYLILLAITIYFIVVHRMPPPALEPVITGLFIVLPAAALIFQYATRRTGISRAILIATPAIIALLLLITPATALIQHAYPVSSTPKLGPLPEVFGPKAPEPGDLMVVQNRVQLAIPFTVTDADKDSNYAVTGVAATVDAPGIHWQSPYITPLQTSRINAGAPISAVPVDMPLAIFNQLGHAPADIHLSITLQQLKADKPSTWKASAGSFAVPGHGICSFDPLHPDSAPVCRYAFKTPDLNFATAPLTATCGDPSAPTQTGVAQMTSGPGFVDFDPVNTQTLAFSNPTQREAPGILCPGTPISFVEGHDQSRLRLELDEKKLVLENYATHATPRRQRALQPQPQPQNQEQDQQ